jgi:hypothetical protein
MNPLYAAAAEVQEFLQERGWPFCFIGGLALLRWGQALITQYIDVMLCAGFGGEGPYIDALLGRFKARTADAAEFARRSRVVLISASNGIPVDLALGAVPFEGEAIRRATPFEFFAGTSLITCSAEDLMVLKAFADRDQDWADIEGIVARQGSRLDWPYMEAQLRPLIAVKDAPDILVRLARLRAKSGT